MDDTDKLVEIINDPSNRFTTFLDHYINCCSLNLIKHVFSGIGE